MKSSSARMSCLNSFAFERSIEPRVVEKDGEFQRLCERLEANDSAVTKVVVDLNESMLLSTCPLGHVLLHNTAVTELELNLNMVNRSYYELVMGSSSHSSLPLLQALQTSPTLQKVMFTTSKSGIPALNALFLSLCLAEIAGNTSITHLSVEAIAWGGIDMREMFTLPNLVELTLTGYSCPRLQEKIETGELVLQNSSLTKLRLVRPNSLSAIALLKGLAKSVSLRQVAVTELERYGNSSRQVAYAIQYRLRFRNSN
jgi:hypothetical protein